LSCGCSPRKSLKKEQKKEPEKNFKKPVTKWNLLRLIDECEGKRFGETGNTRMNVSEDKEQ